MSLEVEFMIKLVHVRVPTESNVEKVHLKISNGREEVSSQFCQKIKNGKASFFREALFLPQSPDGLIFTLFDATSSNPQPVKVWQVKPDELQHLKKRGILHTLSSEYQVQWEGALYEPNQESIIQTSTQKDYSEFMTQPSPLLAQNGLGYQTFNGNMNIFDGTQITGTSSEVVTEKVQEKSKPDMRRQRDRLHLFQ